MIRMFHAHTIRRQSELGGIWKLEKLSEDDQVLAEFSAVVPSCWESMRGLEDFRGHCRYTKSVTVQAGNVRLVFKGVSHTADVYFDGKHIAHHYNAYTPFDVVIPGVEAGTHKIEVIADNRFSEASALHFPNDYRSNGGITRPVALEELPGAFLHHIHVTPRKTETGWTADMTAEVHLVSGDAAGLGAELEIADKTLAFDNLEFDGDVCKLTGSLSFDDVSEWSPENPALYTVKGRLFSGSTPIDDLYDRFGFREVKVDGDKILLNGRPLFLKGFNRHEDYGAIGCAVPENIMNSDIDIIVSAGANMIRTSHYPNDERFLDLCDERGVMVWEEGHARQIYIARLQNPNFKKQSADCIHEMITNHYNHPAIILWGIMNECESYSEYGRECYKLQYDQIRSLDTSRLTTSASNKHFRDLCYDMPDVISLNVYPRWYCEEEPLEYLHNIRDYIDKNGGAGKPVILSEFGADAIYGYRTFSEVKWSENRQANILRELISKYFTVEDLSGLIVWQFADERVDSEFVFQERPKTQNNKGVVDIYRQPKLSFYVVRECYEQRGNYRDEGKKA